MIAPIRDPELPRELESAHPREILMWAWETFSPGIVLTSSFQTQSVPLLHLVSQHTPEMPVVFLDTGYHFPETIQFCDTLTAEFNLNLIVAKSDLTEEDPTGESGPNPINDPHACCMANKVDPIKKVLAETTAWVSGVRKDQSELRGLSSTISYNDFYSVYKICPMTNWTSREVHDYIEKHDLPRHPLWEQGYHSIGCYPCTRPVLNGGKERSGRWSWIEKTECGLHEF